MRTATVKGAWLLRFRLFYLPGHLPPEPGGDGFTKSPSGDKGSWRGPGLQRSHRRHGILRGRFARSQVDSSHRATCLASRTELKRALHPLVVTASLGNGAGSEVAHSPPRSPGMLCGRRSQSRGRAHPVGPAGLPLSPSHLVEELGWS